MKDKRLHKFIAITLCVTLLTISASRVTRVSAIGTSIAAAAGATLCAVGIAYYSYLMLTGAQVRMPDTVQSIQDWLTDTGRKVVQYPSGRAAYEELYPKFLQDPSASLIHDFLDSEVWTWTADKLKMWANDFSSIDVANALAAYTIATTDDLYPTNGFSYSITADLPTVIYTSFPWYEGSVEGFIENVGPFYVDTAHLVYYDYGSNHAVIAHTNINATVRNLRIIEDNTYKFIPQYLDGSTWRSYYSLSWRNGYTAVNGIYYDVALFANGNTWIWQQNSNVSIASSDPRGIVLDSPLFADSVIHDDSTDEDLPMVIAPTEIVEYKPQWPDLPPADDHDYPVIPYVQIPYDPTWIDPVTQVPGGGNWGYDLGDLLDRLEELAGDLVDLSVLSQLINQFKDLMSSDDYYIYYDDSQNNYYQYYTITNYGDNTYNYNIDVSDVDEQLPVDLNTISNYTHNRYLDEVKRSALAGGSIIRDLTVFWYDIDPTIVYIFFGSCIAILIAAFIGKWGHS